MSSRGATRGGIERGGRLPRTDIALSADGMRLLRGF
jgi:hypothetical protein